MAEVDRFANLGTLEQDRFAGVGLLEPPKQDIDRFADLGTLDTPKTEQGITPTGIQSIPLQEEDVPLRPDRNILKRIGISAVKAFAPPPTVRTADIRATEVQNARIKQRKKQGVKRFNEILLQGEFDDIKRDFALPPEAREDEDLRAIPDIVTEEPLGAQILPPERDTEGVLTTRGRVETGTDIAVGVASFITKQLLLKKAFGGAPAVARWEARNLAEGGPVGKGAGVRAGLGVIDKIPTISVLGKAAKVGAGGGFFGTLTALEGGDFVDVTVSTIIGAGFQAWGIKKQNDFAKSYKAGLRKQAFKEIDTRTKVLRSEVNKTLSQELKVAITANDKIKARTNHRNNLRGIKSFQDTEFRRADKLINTQMDKVNSQLRQVTEEKARKVRILEQKEPELARTAERLDPTQRLRAPRAIRQQAAQARKGEKVFVKAKSAKTPEKRVQILKKGFPKATDQQIAEIAQELTPAPITLVEKPTEPDRFADIGELAPEVPVAAPEAKVEPTLPKVPPKAEKVQEAAFQKVDRLDTEIAKIRESGEKIPKDLLAERESARKELLKEGPTFAKVVTEKVGFKQPPTTTALGATRDPVVDKLLKRATSIAQKQNIPAFVNQSKGKFRVTTKRPEQGDFFEVTSAGARFVEGTKLFSTETDAVKEAQSIATNTNKAVFIADTDKGFEITTIKPIVEHVKVNPKVPGITQVERKILAEPIKIAEAELAQEELKKVGFKLGVKIEAAEGRKRLDEFRLAEKLTEKNRQDAIDIVQQFVPQAKQGKFIKRIISAKTSKRVERLAEAIDGFIDKAEHRQSVTKFKTFISETGKRFRRGVEKFGKLPNVVRDKLIKTLEPFDVAKLTEKKRKVLESRDQFIKNVAGSVASAFETLEGDVENLLKIPEAQITELNRLSKDPIAELDTDQINYVRESLENLIAISDKKFLIKERTRAEGVRKDINTARQEVSIKSKVPGITKEIKGLPGFFKKLFTTQQATLKTLVGRATKKINTATDKLINKNLRKVERDTAEALKGFVLTSRKEIKDKLKFTRSASKELDKLIPIRLGGKKFNIDFDNLLGIYQHIKADGNLRQLLKTKGLDITVFERNPKALNVIKEKINVETRTPTLDELRNVVTIIEKHPKFVKLGEAAFKINRETLAPELNKISKQVQNHEIAREKKHWHIQRVFPKKLGGIPTKTSVSIEQQGRYQPKTGGTQRIRIIPFRQEFISSLQSDATFVGGAVPLRDINAFVNNEQWQEAMRQAGRKEELNAIIELLNRVQGQPNAISMIERASGKLLNNFGKAVLSLRLSGYGVQTASIPAAFETIEEKYFRQADVLTTLVEIPIKSVKEMKDLSPILWLRWEARRFNYVTGAVAAQHAFDTLILEDSPILDKGLNQYTWGDQKAIFTIYKAAQDKVFAEQGLKKGTIENKKAAIELVEDALESQPQWDTIHRNLLTSSPNVLLRGSLMFLSARNAQFNVAMRAVDDFQKGRIGAGEASKRIKGVMYANILVAVVKGLVKLGVTVGITSLAFLGDDEEKKKAKEALGRIAKRDIKRLPVESALNLLSLPAFGNIASGIAREVIRRVRTPGLPIRELQQIRTGNIFVDLSLDVTDVMGSVGKMTQLLLTGETFQSGPDEGKPKWQREAKRVANGLAELIAVRFGLPFTAPRGEVSFRISQFAKEKKKAEPERLQNLAFKFTDKDLTPKKMKDVRKELRLFGIDTEADFKQLLKDRRKRKPAKTVRGRASQIRRDNKAKKRFSQK